MNTPLGARTAGVRAAGVASTAPAPVVYLDGSAPVVQTASAGAGFVDVQAGIDYFDAGDAAHWIVGTGGADIVLLGAGAQTLSAGSDDDMVPVHATVSGATAAPLLVTGSADNDLISGDASDPGRVTAAYSGARWNYQVVLREDLLFLPDRRSVVSDDTDTLVSVTRFRFADGSNTGPKTTWLNAPARDVLAALPKHPAEGRVFPVQTGNRAIRLD